MEDFINLLNSMIGQFVLDSGGIYKGQCPQLVKWLIEIMGCPWVGNTGNGNKVIDTMVNNYGGYYGESKYGYRIFSCDVKGNSDGHCGIEVKVNGKWIRYEQNINNPNTNTANFGCGTVYSISKFEGSHAGEYNYRYAGHPSVDYYIEQHSKKPEPSPQPKSDYPDWFVKWVNEQVNNLKNSVKEK